MWHVSENTNVAMIVRKSVKRVANFNGTCHHKRVRMRENKFCTDKLFGYCISPSDVLHERKTKLYSFASTRQYFASVVT